MDSAVRRSPLRGATPSEILDFYVPERPSTADECWLWRGTRNRAGYGVMSIGGRQYRAPRVAYEQWVGPIPEGLQIDHLCFVKACCRPSHLEAVTGRVNLLRSTNPPAENARKQTCKYGHEFTAENTAMRASGGRTCRACARRADAQYRMRVDPEEYLSRRRERRAARSPAMCECGATVSVGNEAKHRRTNKHLSAIAVD